MDFLKTTLTVETRQECADFTLQLQNTEPFIKYSKNITIQAKTHLGTVVLGIVEIVSSSKHTLFDKGQVVEASSLTGYCECNFDTVLREKGCVCALYEPAHAFLLQTLQRWSIMADSQAGLCRVTMTQRVQLVRLIFIPVKSSLTGTTLPGNLRISPSQKP